jgi:cell division septal protein FtsQ
MRLWKKKISDEKAPLWKISPRVVDKSTTTFTRVRKNTKPLLQNINVGVGWIKNYLRTVGWIFIGWLMIVFVVVMNTTPMFSLKPDRIELELNPEPVFDRVGISSILRDFAGRNIMTLSTQEIFKSLSQNIRHIQSVEKTLLFPDGIHIKVTSFPPLYRAYIGEETFLLTENGQLISDIPAVEVQWLHIHTLAQDPQLQRNTPLHQDDMYLLGLIISTWKKEMPTYPLTQIDFFDQEKEVHLTSQNTRFILTLYDGSIQVSNLAKLAKSELINISRQYYIDLRIPSRLYSCDRDKAECAQNIGNIYQ